LAKPFVVISNEQARVPFLRGILIRSLQQVGLSFEDARRVATTVRDDLRSNGEITGEELRKRVGGYLEPFGDEVVRRYLNPVGPTPSSSVVFPNGTRAPFSRGRHRLGLESCGLTTDDADRIANRVFRRLADERTEEVDSARLAHLTHDILQEEMGQAAAHRYVVWEEYHHSHRPLIVLIGGTAGSGKSTIAASLAHRLDIVRMQSTDMLREVMRGMIPEHLMPVLHTSTYAAWKQFPTGTAEETSESRIAQGFMLQVELVATACTAVIERALQERVSLVIEGVHVHPLLIERLRKDTDAVIVPLMLGVLKPSELKHRLRGRGKKVPGRRSQRFLKNFEAIWTLQSFLLAEADGSDFSIVPNEGSEEATVQSVMDIALDALSKAFQGAPEEVFG
jgi:2-phosphoglycerate kinase